MPLSDIFSEKSFVYNGNWAYTPEWSFINLRQTRNSWLRIHLNCWIYMAFIFPDTSCLHPVTFPISTIRDPTLFSFETNLIVRSRCLVILVSSFFFIDRVRSTYFFWFCELFAVFKFLHFSFFSNCYGDWTMKFLIYYYALIRLIEIVRYNYLTILRRYDLKK